MVEVVEAAAATAKVSRSLDISEVASARWACSCATCTPAFNILFIFPLYRTQVYKDIPSHSLKCLV